MDGGKETSSSTVVNNPDEAQMNNIDLGGVLNLAAEDTLNIRLLHHAINIGQKNKPPTPRGGRLTSLDASFARCFAF